MTEPRQAGRAEAADSTLFEIVIANGTVVTSEGIVLCDVGIRDGRVAALGSGLNTSKVIDASGKYVLPGVVDPHVHLLDLTVAGTVNERQVEDFESGTRAAAQGGVTTVVDFAYQRQGESLRDAVNRASEEAQGSAWVDYSFHVWVSDPTESVFTEVRELVDDGYPSFKVFMALESFDGAVPQFLQLFAAVEAAGGLVVIHCEDRGLMEFCIGRQVARRQDTVEYYPQAKPTSVEVAATARAVEMCRITGAQTYIVHVSCEQALDVVRNARSDGLPIHAETRPLYLHLTEERYSEAAGAGAKYLGVPPLRREGDRRALWAGLRAGEIDVVATDHVGWSLAQKLRYRDIPRIASGVQALATNLALLHSEGVLPARISLSQMVSVLSTNPAKLLGLYPKKGSISVGADADLVVFDPSSKVTISTDDLEGATDFDPYEGMDVVGWPEMTLLGGNIVYENGQVTGAPTGKLLHRSAHPG